MVDTPHGEIHCTWTAVFTLQLVNASGDAIFSGDGYFTVLGGTGRYRRASGSFVTNFETPVVPAGAAWATAAYEQSGAIHLH